MESSIIIIWLTEFLVVIPIQIGMVLMLYDSYFQNGFSPYNRMGTVLTGFEKKIFEETREIQIKKFRQFSIIFNTLPVFIFFVVVSLLMLEIDRYDSLVIKILGIFYMIIFTIIITSFSYEYLKPRDLRSMIEVVKSIGYTKDLVRDQVSILNKSDLIRNKDYHILVRSFFKKYHPNYSTYHDIPYVNYSIFNKEKNGTLDEKKIPEELKNDRNAINYLTKTVLQDLKLTTLWHNDKKKEIIMYIALVFEIFAIVFLFSIDDSNLLLLSLSLIFVFIPGLIVSFPFKERFLLNPKKVKQILTENNVEYTSYNYFDKIVEIIESKYPYINL